MSLRDDIYVALILILFCVSGPAAGSSREAAGKDIYAEKAINRRLGNETNYRSGDEILGNLGVVYLVCKLIPEAPPNVFPQDMVTAAKVMGATGGTLSMVSGSGSSVVQIARVMAITKILSCRDASEYVNDDPAWADSPTQLSVGNDLLRYDTGLVIGNLAIVGVTAVGAAALATWFDAKKVRFPSVIILPALFLSTATTTSAVVLMRFGSTLQKTLGGAELALSGAGAAAVGWSLLSSNFIAQFDSSEGEWVEPTHSGYLEKYGQLFKDYRGGYKAFILVEIAMNAASGVLAAYVPEQDNCDQHLIIANCVYGAYALAMLATRPHIEVIDKIYFCIIPTLQVTPLILSLAGTSKTVEDRKDFQAAANGVPVILYYVLISRSLYEAMLHSWSLYKFYHRMRHPVPSDSMDTGVGDEALLNMPNPLN